MVYLIKDETLNVPKTALFHLQKGDLTSKLRERVLLNGLIKLVFTPEELASLKAICKRELEKSIRPVEIQYHRRPSDGYTSWII